MAHWLDDQQERWLMAQTKDKLVFNAGALLGSCQVIPGTGPIPIRVPSLGSRVNALRAFDQDTELSLAAAQAAVVRQLGGATARTGPVEAAYIVGASETNVSVSALLGEGGKTGVPTVVKLEASATGLRFAQVIEIGSISIKATVSFDAQLSDATIALSGAFEGLKIAGIEFNVKVHSQVAKPLWNPSELISLDAKEVVFAAPAAGLQGTLRASRQSLANVSFAAPGKHAGIDVSGNVVTVAQKQKEDVGRVIIGDLLVMRDSNSHLRLELAAIRAEFSRVIMTYPGGGGGTHDDGAHGGGH
jgi:hypothetical protein